MGMKVAGFKSIPNSICFGVTGHRKLRDLGEVETAVKGAIDAELHIAEQSDEAARALRVLSPLAEGADRAVAKAVLSYPGAQLEVVLPLVLEDYLEDFETVESRQEFTELLSLCPQPIVLRATPIEAESHAPEQQAELRREAYSQVGKYVVDHCDVLIAVWDGEPSRGRGGTAEVVHYAEDRNRPVRRVWKDSFGA